MTKICFWMAVLVSQVVSVGFAAETRVVNGQTLYKDERPNSKLWCTKPWDGDKCPGQAGEISGPANPPKKREHVGSADKNAHNIRGLLLTVPEAGKPGGPAQNCYFPPCRPEGEWPMRGNVDAGMAGVTVAVMDQRGTVVSSGLIQRDGSFLMPPPTGTPNGPHKTCILRPSQPPECGEFGAMAGPRHIPIRMLTSNRPNASAFSLSGGVATPVENCYFPPCTAESSRGMYWPASGLPIGSRLTVVDATGATVDSSVVQPDGSLSIPPPQQNVSSRGKGPYKICILHPQTPIKCGPVGAAQLHTIGGTHQLPKPMPTRPNLGSK